MGEDVIVDERTVDVHISWLRGKLSDAGLDAAAIRTVYGVGIASSSPDDRATPRRRRKARTVFLELGRSPRALAARAAHGAGVWPVGKSRGGERMLERWRSGAWRQGLLAIALAGAIGMGSLPVLAQETDLSSLSGQISADGSSTVGPLTQAAAEQFNEQAPKRSDHRRYLGDRRWLQAFLRR